MLDNSLSEINFPELAFPCRYPIKVMGLNQNDFLDMVIGILTRHISYLSMDDFSSRTSSGGKYISISVMFMAESREQVDALYKELAENIRVLTAF